MRLSKDDQQEMLLVKKLLRQLVAAHDIPSAFSVLSTVASYASIGQLCFVVWVIQVLLLCLKYLLVLYLRWGTMDAEIRVPLLVGAQDYQWFLFEPGVGQNIALPANRTSTHLDYLISAFLSHSSSFLSQTSQIRNGEMCR